MTDQEQCCENCGWWDPFSPQSASGNCTWDDMGADCPCWKPLPKYTCQNCDHEFDEPKQLQTQPARTNCRNDDAEPAEHKPVCPECDSGKIGLR